MKATHKGLEAVVFIVNIGKARKVIKQGRMLGISGATVFLATGTAKYTNKWLALLDLVDIRKEVVMLLSDTSTVEHAMPSLCEKFKFTKPNHGIAFRMPITEIIGSQQYANQKSSSEVEKPMHNAIFVIVDKGVAEDVFEAASEAGSKGGTIINARGAGVHETTKVFNMEIEPEKEVVLILAEEASTDKITAAIQKKIHINEPGKGLMFVQAVKKTYGLIDGGSC